MEKMDPKKKVLKLSDFDRKVIHTYLNEIADMILKPTLGATCAKQNIEVK